MTLSATSEKRRVAFSQFSPLLFRVKPLALGGVLQYAAAERSPPEPSQQLLFYKSNCTVEVGLESKVSLRERGLFKNFTQHFKVWNIRLPQWFFLNLGSEF